MFLLLTKQVLLFSSRLFTVEILLKPCKYEFPYRVSLPSSTNEGKKERNDVGFQKKKKKIVYFCCDEFENDEFESDKFILCT